MPNPRRIKHNPLFMGDDQLEEAFVVRSAELEILARLVRANVGEVNQHALVIGSRGMGKTMLMRRLALLTRADEDLCGRWYPIVAPEEIYDAGTEGEIWLAVLKQLADQLREEGGDFDRWHGRYESLLKERNEERLRARTLGALTEYAHENGCRLLVLIENLQMLLGEQFAKDADWDLRKTLLNRSEIMLVLTATARFEHIESARFAAFELFRELELRPLGSAECRRLWLSVSGQDLNDQRIRPMEILTGGNPRLLAILASFAPERPLHELIDNLAELIDDHTPFLKSNIDALPPQERRVFVNLAKLWEPSTARRVGDRCRITSSTASAVLKSLVHRGAVVERGKEGRGKLYQVAERIYCIYYLMRLSGSDADRMRAFVRFMVPLYGEVGLAQSLAEAACAAEVPEPSRYIEGYRALLEFGLPEAVKQRILEVTPDSFLSLPEVRAILPVLRLVHSAEAEVDEMQEEATTSVVIAPEEAIDQLGVILQELSGSEEPERVVSFVSDFEERLGEPKTILGRASLTVTAFYKAMALVELGRADETVEVFDKLESLFVDTDSKPDDISKLAVGFGKSYAFFGVGRYSEALACCEQMIVSFSDLENSAAHRLLAMAHSLKSLLYVQQGLGDFDGAVESGERAIELMPDETAFRLRLGNVFACLDRWEDAFAQARFFNDDEAFVEKHVDDLLVLYVDAAADGQAEQALEVLTGTAAERAMEPLVVALKELAGQTYRAPQEVGEVKDDLLARIETRRLELAERRSK